MIAAARRPENAPVARESDVCYGTRSIKCHGPASDVAAKKTEMLKGSDYLECTYAMTTINIP